MTRDTQRVPGRKLKRRVATRAPRKTIVVFCEGEKTEPEYLNALKRQPSVRDVAAVDLRVETGHGGSVPLTLVSLATAARKKAVDEDAEIDEFWCVFDVEWPVNHPNLSVAAERARKQGIKLAVSNPCFELWLILHFKNCARWLNNEAACKLRNSLDGSVGKGLDAAKYMPLRNTAVARAAALEVRHAKDGTVFPDDNPSSGVYRLIESVEPHG